MTLFGFVASFTCGIFVDFGNYIHILRMSDYTRFVLLDTYACKMNLYGIQLIRYKKIKREPGTRMKKLVSEVAIARRNVLSAAVK